MLKFSRMFIPNKKYSLIHTHTKKKRKEGKVGKIVGQDIHMYICLYLIIAF
jgi:hypothetical protein